VRVGKTVRFLQAAAAAAAAAAGPQGAVALIVEDSPAHACALEHEFSQLGPVEIAETVAAATACITRWTLRVAVVDDELPDGEGLDVAAHVRESQPGARVVLMTEDLDRELSWRAAKLDVRVMPKPQTAGEIALLRGMVDDDEAHEHDVDRWRDELRLTPAQRAVLSETVRGRCAKEIAKTLGLSYRTVHAHLSAIHHKARVASTTALIAKFWTWNRRV
jgi:DNA-binding NarL/FixJ family response regulator